MIVRLYVNAFDSCSGDSCYEQKAVHDPQIPLLLEGRKKALDAGSYSEVDFRFRGVKSKRRMEEDLRKMDAA
jgi:hypothetical protein